MGRTGGHQRGLSMAASGEIPMATVKILSHDQMVLNPSDDTVITRQPRDDAGVRGWLRMREHARDGPS